AHDHRQRPPPRHGLLQHTRRRVAGGESHTRGKTARPAARSPEPDDSMKLHEYQAKELFARYAIPVQNGVVIERPQQVEGISLTYPLVTLDDDPVLDGDRSEEHTSEL